MTSIPSFSSGERLSAAKLNALADAVRELQREAAASRITSVNGGTFSRTAGGTSLDIRRAAPPQVPAQQTAAPQRHPFKVEVLDVGGRRTLGVFEPWVYVTSLSVSGILRIPHSAGGVYGEVGARFALLDTPPPGRHVLCLNVRTHPGHWMVEGGDGNGGAQPFYSEVRGIYTDLSLDWDDRGDGETLSFSVADVTISVDEAGAESFAVVQHLRSTPFIPQVLPDPSKLTTAS